MGWLGGLLRCLGAPLRSVAAAAGTAWERYGPGLDMTDCILLANGVAFAAQQNNPGLTDIFCFNPAAVLAGQWWRLFTSTFLHGSIEHLLGNSILLNNCGPDVELRAGGARFLAIYMASDVVACGLGLLLGQTSCSIGASAAIFGLLGAKVALAASAKGSTKKSGILRSGMVVLKFCLLAWQLLPEEGTDGVDHMAHLGGAAGGMLAGYLLAPKDK